MWKATSKATAANWIYNELVSPWTKFRVAAAEHPRPHACLLRPDALGVGRQASEPRSCGKLKIYYELNKYCSLAERNLAVEKNRAADWLISKIRSVENSNYDS